MDPQSQHMSGTDVTKGGVMPRGTPIEILTIRPVGDPGTGYPSTGRTYSPYSAVLSSVRCLPVPLGGTTGRAKESVQQFGRMPMNSSPRVTNGGHLEADLGQQTPPCRAVKHAEGLMVSKSLGLTVCVTYRPGKNALGERVVRIRIPTPFEIAKATPSLRLVVATRFGAVLKRFFDVVG